MRTRTHTKSAGTDAAADFMGQVSRRNEELQFFDSTTVKVEQTTRGVRWHTKVTPSRPGSTGTSDFRGVYTPGSYDAMEWVVIQSGPGQGAYISTADGNTNDPRTGINWIQFSSLNQWF